MKLLVVGGSYFFGRVFTMLAAKEHQVTLLNRGTYPLALAGVREWRADRHDGEALGRLGAEEFDTIVDFCAYREGDVAGLLEGLGCRAFQYLLVSTADVYGKWTGKPLTEDAPLETRRFGGEAGDYIWQKILLERELERACRERGMARTLLRPAVLYGPFNYAMRESAYVQMALKGQEILFPAGAPGRFQPVYVKDAAAMALALCGNERAMGNAYNLAGEPVDYETFLETLLKSAGRRELLRPVPYGELLAQNGFLPFPVTAEETEFYDGSRVVSDTGIGYTPLEEGLKKTWAAFAGVYS